MPDRPGHFHRHRFPAEIISHAVWLYHRFALSFRDIEELLFERGIVVSYESIRAWVEKFGGCFAAELRRQERRPGRIWHLDEVFLKIRGEQAYLWRAVDEHGQVLDILVQTQRDADAAERFFQRLLKHAGGPPERIRTDKLASYAAAKRRLPELTGVEHEQVHAGSRLNNRPSRASTHEIAGVSDAAFQVRGLGPAVPFRVQPLLQPFPAAPSSPEGVRVSHHPAGALSEVA